MGSQSHKHGCLCATNSDRRVYEFKAACGRVSKYYKRQLKILERKSIVKLPLYHSEFVALMIDQVKSPPDFFYLETISLIGFPR